MKLKKHSETSHNERMILQILNNVLLAAVLYKLSSKVLLKADLINQETYIGRDS